MYVIMTEITVVAYVIMTGRTVVAYVIMTGKNSSSICDNGREKQ